jgi:hypothetical protein
VSAGTARAAGRHCSSAPAEGASSRPPLGNEEGCGRSVTEPMETSPQDRLTRTLAVTGLFPYDFWSTEPVRVNLPSLEMVNSLNWVQRSRAASATAATIAVSAKVSLPLRCFTARRFTRVKRFPAGRASPKAAATTREPILAGRLHRLGNAAASVSFVAPVASSGNRTKARSSR